MWKEKIKAFQKSLNASTLSQTTVLSQMKKPHDGCEMTTLKNQFTKLNFEDSHWEFLNSNLALQWLVNLIA